MSEPVIVRDYDHAITTLREARRTKRVTQSGLAEQLHTTQSAVCDWERGRAVLLTSSLLALAEALGYDLALVPREEA